MKIIGHIFIYLILYIHQQTFLFASLLDYMDQYSLLNKSLEIIVPLVLYNYSLDVMIN